LTALLYAGVKGYANDLILMIVEIVVGFDVDKALGVVLDNTVLISEVFFILFIVSIIILLLVTIKNIVNFKQEESIDD
jgi:hypothetical protein